MEPATVAESLTKISQQYERSRGNLEAANATLTHQASIITQQQKTIAARDLEISELKKQRDTDLPRLAREIDSWKAKHDRLQADVPIQKKALEETEKELAAAKAELTEVKKILNSETDRAEALIQKYDPQIQAELAAKAEAERLRQIAELEAKLKALKKE